MASAVFQSDPRVKIVEDYLSHLDFAELDLWTKLDVLSTHTRIEGSEIPHEGIVVGPDGAFSAVVNLYVSLQYGKDNDEGFTTSDSFLAKVRGHFDGQSPVIDSSTVDTSSFYE